MVGNIRKACDSLSKNPERGHTPDELSLIGQFEYRQIIAKKYRIIYQLAKPNLFYLWHHPWQSQYRRSIKTTHPFVSGRKKGRKKGRT